MTGYVRPKPGAQQYAYAQIEAKPREDMGERAFGIGFKETPEATTPIQFFRPEQAT